MTPVLDHGFVRLVESMGNDLSVVRAARVSYNAAWRGKSDDNRDDRLIHYLMRNMHTSPFEAVEFQFEVMAPIFVFRQWHRHRTWSYNELSGRYRELPSTFYIPKPSQVGEQSKTSKQARVITEDSVLLGERREECELLECASHRAFQTYKTLLDSGWPRELARSILPLNTYSHMFAKCDLHNLFHFLTLRLHHHAQYEIRVYAEAILELIRPIVPVCVEAWEDNKEKWERALKLIEDGPEVLKT